MKIRCMDPCRPQPKPVRIAFLLPPCILFSVLLLFVSAKSNEIAAQISTNSVLDQATATNVHVKQACPEISDGFSISGTISLPGGQDCFQFDGQVNDIVSVYAANQMISGTLGMRIAILKPDGSEFRSARHTCCNADVEIRDQVLPETGIYVVNIAGYLDATGSYAFGFSNLRADTTHTTPGQQLSGTIDYVGDEDAYTINGLCNDQLTVFADNLTNAGSLGMRITVLNPDLTQLRSAQHTCCNADVEIRNQVLQQDGTYTMIIAGYGDTTGPYSGSVSYLDLPAECKDDDPPPCPPSIEFGENLSCTIETAGQSKSFSFDAKAKDRVLIRLGFHEDGPDPYVRLFDSQSTQLCEGQVINGTFDKLAAEIESCTLPNDGTYTIIAAESEGDEIGGYTISLQRLNNLEQTLTFSQTVSQTLGVAASSGHTFLANMNDAVSVQMSFDASSPDPHIRLFDPKGDKLCDAAFSNGTFDSKSAEIESCLLPEHGAYTMIATENEGDETGAYALALQRLTII
ncbi:hypothetical protein KFU94_04125 [Chloroflexi bacterium TSY]|nr:hypothetical protein [Chloroflexi bacterium TSY]